MIRGNFIGELNEEMDGKRVVLAGWVHELRETANVTFLLLRDSTGVVQVTGKKGVVSDETIRSMSLPKESVIKVTGIVKKSKEAKKGFEIIPSEIVNLNPLRTKIPFEVTGKVPADLDVRLNYRYIDLRRQESRAVFNIQSTVLNTFTEFFSSRGFRNIRTPSIIAEASEGGAELFKVKYFEKDAYLAQSPQLYKQLAIIGGLDKVFMIVPVFRAEKSNTVYHLTESTQMDIEMGFAEADDVIELLIGVVREIIKRVKERNSEDLATLKTTLEVPEPKVVTYKQVVEDMAKNGYKMEYGDDISREIESGIEKVYGDMIVVKEFPAKLRAFYSMPKEGTDLTNSFDMIYKGLEISSGAQRIHDPDMLIEALKRKGLDPKGFEFYINAFRCGAPPHAGWSIGLERLTMRISGVKNIRESSMFPRDRDRVTP